ncbi:MAG TPA: dienelactone hydrolase family protein [Chromatiales bacterium]|nr:dienelactone hydrolase family protein [Chromatiales bacterium]
MKKVLAGILALMVCGPGLASAEVVGREVDYRAGGAAFKGYLAWDDALRGKRPGVLVVHEWWGHNAYARKRARMLAGLGYVALAVDMYGEGRQASHPGDASKFSSAVMNDLPAAEARFLAAYRLLQRQPQVDPGRIAAIGYCFGGGVVLAMARRGVALDGVVSFHGSLMAGAPAQPGKVIARVLVLNGADDPFVTAEQRAAFKRDMAQAGVTYEMIDYPGATHSFTNPDADRLGKQFQLPLAYSARADQESWNKMQEFFRQIFSRPAGH